MLIDSESVAIAMGLLPLAFLGFLRAWGQRRDVGWWWVAGAFGISWLADVVSLFLVPAPDRWAVSLIYPIAQTAIIVRATLLARAEAIYFLAVLVVVGCTVVVFRGIGPDAILRSVAWLTIVALVWGQRALPFRTCLLVYFGLGWVAWLAHVEWIRAHPHVHGTAPTYYPYEGVRLAGLLLFCWAARSPGAKLRAVEGP